jgi:hypothetical protein
MIGGDALLAFVCALAATAPASIPPAKIDESAIHSFLFTVVLLLN